MEQESYHTIETSAVNEYKDRGSRFIAYAFPVLEVEAFKINLAQLKKEHSKATHHCFAYRIGIDGKLFRVSDDGEPSGTAGRPILGQIDSRQLVNTLVVVVRYFGGTLLGVPGLINAYKSATALVLQITPVVQRAVEIIYRLEFDYTQLNDVMTIIKQHNCSVIEQQMQLFCMIRIGVPVSRQKEVVFRFREMKNVEIVRS